MDPRARGSARDLRWLVAILAGGLLVRLALAPFGGFEFDLDTNRSWALALEANGPTDFYAATGARHLPGDLWMFWALGYAFELFAPGRPTQDYLFKLVPILADVAVAGLLYAIGRTVAGGRAGLLAASLYAFNPAPIFLASTWGQWDSVSAALLLLAIWFSLRGWIVAALPTLSWAALIKPQLALVGAIALVFVISRGSVSAPWRQVAAGGLLAVALVVALTLPFQAPPWPGEQDLYDRVQYAADAHKEVTVGAFNLWRFWLDPNQPTDLRVFALGAEYRTWGLALLALAIITVLARVARQPNDRRLLWACSAAALAVFVLPTRIHERYALPAVALAAVLGAVEKPYRPVAVLLSLSLFANLYWVYDSFGYAVPSLPLLTGEGVPQIFAVVNVGTIVALLLLPPGKIPHRDSDERVG